MEKMYCGLQRGKSGSIETRTKELKETGDDNLPWIWLLGLTSDPRRAVTVCVWGGVAVIYYGLCMEGKGRKLTHEYGSLEEIRRAKKNPIAEDKNKVLKEVTE